MTTKTQPYNQINIEDIKYCSEYDEDCKDIDPAECFIGMPKKCPNCGETFYFGIADGVCREMEIRKF